MTGVDPKLYSPRAHFLQGALSEEELARLHGQNVSTLNPSVHWEIHNVSGVCGGLWAEGALWAWERFEWWLQASAQGPLTLPGPSPDAVLRTHLLLGSVFGPE